MDGSSTRRVAWIKSRVSRWSAAPLGMKKGTPKESHVLGDPVVRP